MLKHLMSGSSLLALALYDGNDDDGAPDPKAKLRAELAKGNKPEGGGDNDGGDKEAEKEDDKEAEEDDEDENEDDGEDSGEVDPPEDETEEQKKEREERVRVEAKAQRKQDRMQRRIDKAVADRNSAQEEIARLKKQIEANPDSKLTEEEVEAKAEAKAAEKIAKKELEDLQVRFEKDCDALQKDAVKADKDFNDKINDIAEDVGPIPSFMIGILSDMDNGGEVLAFVANDDELAEDIWRAKPTKMTKMLVEISNKLAEKKKPEKKQISRVPDPGERIKGNRVVSNIITEADAKNMDTYVAKRQRQMLEKKKAMGFN